MRQQALRQQGVEYFALQNMVVFAPSDHQKRLIKLYGEGPFWVIKVTDAPEHEEERDGHPQKLTITLSNGDTRTFSGGLLTHY